MATLNKQTACQKIISGGQTGVDRGALDACIEKKFPCGGWCPKGRLAEDGPIDLKYPLKETDSKSYEFRTKLNVKDSDATLIIVHDILSGGTLTTWIQATVRNKPLKVVHFEKFNMKNKPEEISAWISENGIQTLNVAGPRASDWPEGYSIAFQLISALIDQFR